RQGLHLNQLVLEPVDLAERGGGCGVYDRDSKGRTDVGKAGNRSPNAVFENLEMIPIETRDEPVLRIDDGYVDNTIDQDSLRTGLPCLLSGRVSPNRGCARSGSMSLCARYRYSGTG